MKTEIFCDGKPFFSFEHKKFVSVQKAIDHAKKMVERIENTKLVKEVSGYVVQSNGKRFNVKDKN